MKAGNSFGCSDHETAEFRILKKESGAISRTIFLDFRRQEFHLSREPLKRITRNTALERRVVQQRWSIFKDQFLQCQEMYIPTSRKSSKSDRRISKNTQLNLDKKRKCTRG